MTPSSRQHALVQLKKDFAAPTPDGGSHLEDHDIVSRVTGLLPTLVADTTEESLHLCLYYQIKSLTLRRDKRKAFRKQG